MTILLPVALWAVVRALSYTQEDMVPGEEQRRSTPGLQAAGCFAHSSAREWASLPQSLSQYEKLYFAAEG